MHMTMCSDFAILKGCCHRPPAPTFRELQSDAVTRPDGVPGWNVSFRGLMSSADIEV